MENPKISVLMPVYNGEKFLQETLDSLWNQTFTDFELVIVDDGSTDRTADIIQSQQDDRIKYYRNEYNLKIVATLNHGLKLCRGKYIARMDADDICMPERLQRQWEYMEANPQIVLCGTSIIKFSESYTFEDRRGGDNLITRAKLVFDTAINHPSAIFRNDIVQQNHLTYPSEYPHAEDYAFWYELTKYGEIANLDEILLKYRMHGDNISMKFNTEQYNSMNKIRKLILQEFWGTESLEARSWILMFDKLLAFRNIGIGEMIAMDKLLIQLVEKNKTTKSYLSNALSKNAAWFWYVVYVHENCLRYTPLMLIKFIFNKRSIVHYLDKEYKKKLFIKSLLFWKKK
ncbi:glycosyltransferase family 2 protein [Sphingobacterium multivorum]|uniref:glycosyltransferase family 2 protein n=1 Tax=Sphingobacterium multivorum TaxID=28454 RepID=UPI00289D2DA1|nr:glycosyltransferase family 2 protein [Sphingobacterium multivorum]